MIKWVNQKIGDIAISYSGGTPSRSRPDFYNGQIPWISSGEVNQSSISKTKETITTVGLKSSSAKMIPKNAVLIAMYGATAGQVSKLLIDATSNQAVLALIPDLDIINDYFLYYQLNLSKEKILYLAQGSGQPNLSKDLIDNFHISLPESLPHQRKIAKILSTIDAVIEKTGQAIQKYKAIKQGMMHDLFTRGIDISNGELRPTYQQAPHLYKKTELGWIPKEWEFVALGDVGDFKNGVNKDKQSFGFGTQFVNIIDAYPEKLIVENLGRVNINKNEIDIYSLDKGDIIFVRSSVKPEGVGYNTIFYESTEPIVYCGFMIRYRIHEKDVFIPEYYNNYFRFSAFRKRLLAVSTVSANTNINQDSLSSLLMIKVKADEQNKAIIRINSIRDKIASESIYFEKLQNLKQGLMQDLLTGKVEVKVPKDLPIHKTQYPLAAEEKPTNEYE